MTLMKSRRLIASPRLRTGIVRNYTSTLAEAPGGRLADPMSALGQKQTYAVQQPTPALLPIATAKADIRW